MFSTTTYINKSNEYRLFVMSIYKTMKNEDFLLDEEKGYSEKYSSLVHNFNLCLLNGCKVILLRNNIDFKSQNIENIVGYVRKNLDYDSKLKNIYEKFNFLHFAVTINECEKAYNLTKLLIEDLTNFVYSLSGFLN